MRLPESLTRALDVESRGLVALIERIMSEHPRHADEIVVWLFGQAVECCQATGLDPSELLPLVLARMEDCRTECPS